ncbi:MULTISPECIES: 3'-5' exonuclease [Aeromonas]|uniref:3'-5' exonuclease n=1 Tax=Aeromonas TaxID=642 RepID=UPI00225BB815|nr:3'-5' exonuclease [Aeromonas veronii]MCX4045671.1 3'-5' exoribonuclease [Aeromonas veronii]
MSNPSLVAVVDIETLAQGHNAVIGTIGVVIVDVAQLRAVDEFYCRVDLAQGRQHDDDTMAFWERQRIESPAAWEEMFGNAGRLFLVDALKALSNFLGRHFDKVATVELMGNGSEFDNVLLADAYLQWGVDQPWWFRGNQSLRTVVWMGRQLLGIDPKYQLPFEGCRHHALHDARHEAAYLIHILTAFKQGLAGGELAGYGIGSGATS